MSEGGRGAACLERLGFDRAGVGTKQSRRVPAARRSNRHERRRLPQGPCKARGRVWVAGRGGLSPGPAARPAAANHAPVAQRCSAAAAAVAAATSPAATTVAATVAASTPAARRQQRSRAGSTGPPHQACTVAGAGSSPRLAARAAPGGRRRSSCGGPTAPRHDARKAPPTSLIEVPIYNSGKFLLSRLRLDGGTASTAERSARSSGQEGGRGGAGLPHRSSCTFGAAPTRSS